ncbi:MAG: hypothetical protein PHO67_03960 [Candidatus Omnitrophica bacterium]|nr:hypothetical protein [Candidatus Omnitrophota bacterium]
MSKKSQIDKWSKLYGRPITEEEYRQICDDLSRYFKTLHKWNKQNESKLNAG